MPELLAKFLDIYGRLLIAAVLFELGYSRWQHRKYDARLIWPLYLMAIALYYVVVH